MLLEDVQLEATQAPDLSTWLASAHARHALDPASMHEAHDLSQLLQLDDVMSRNSDRAHVGRHLPDERTGRDEGHVLHWSKAPPEQVVQSGWQGRHAPSDENVLEGQEVVQVPLIESRLELQV